MNITVVTITNAICAAMLAMMLLCDPTRGNGRRVDHQLFASAVNLILVGCVADWMTFYFDGRPGTVEHISGLLANTFMYALYPTLAVLWVLILHSHLYQDTVQLRKLYPKVLVPLFVMLGILLVNLIEPCVFQIDTYNVFRRLPFAYAYRVFPVGMLIYSIFIQLGYQKRYGKLHIFSMEVFLLPMFVGAVLNVMFMNLPVLLPAVSIGTLGIFIVMQNERCYRDNLTGLYNRAFLDTVFQHTMTAKHWQYGGMMIDINQFKRINDNHGHSTGDDALKEIARVLRQSLPQDGIAIRYAGDEFLLLARAEKKEDLQEIDQRIRKKLDDFNESGLRPYKLYISCGYDLFDKSLYNLDGFLRRLDEAMYQDKGKFYREHREFDRRAGRR